MLVLKGQPNVEAYVRRKSVFGEWIWLASKVVQYVNNGDITAYIVEETIVENERLAIAVNRVTRATAILIQAVDSAWISKSTPKKTAEETASEKPTELPVGSIQDQNVQDLQTWQQAGLPSPRAGDQDDINRTAEFLMQNAVEKKKIFDAMSMCCRILSSVKTKSKTYPEEYSRSNLFDRRQQRTTGTHAAALRQSDRLHADGSKPTYVARNINHSDPGIHLGGPLALATAIAVPELLFLPKTLPKDSMRPSQLCHVGTRSATVETLERSSVKDRIGNAVINVEELKRCARANGLAVGGTKNELMMRPVEAGALSLDNF